MKKFLRAAFVTLLLGGLVFAGCTDTGDGQDIPNIPDPDEEIVTGSVISSITGWQNENLLTISTAAGQPAGNLQLKNGQSIDLKVDASFATCEWLESGVVKATGTTSYTFSAVAAAERRVAKTYSVVARVKQDGAWHLATANITITE